jgi:anti-sigma factor RsiW
MSIFESCARYRDDLGAFVDGELSGSSRLQVTAHLERCPACTVEAERVRNIGERLREAAGSSEPLPPTGGLAGGVVARAGAEAAQSWRALIDRGLDDWHWFIVGGGSVAATFVSMLAATAIVVFGSAPVQQDSLAGLMSSLETQPGTLLVEVGGAKGAPPMQVESGASKAIVVPAELGVSEPALVSLIMSLVLSDRGGIVALADLREADRRSVEAILQQIGDHRERSSGPGARGRLDVVRVRLLTTTEVSVPGLW